MKKLLQDAAKEIEKLRIENGNLNAQLGVVEVFAAALGLRKNQGGMVSGPNVLYYLNKAIDEMPEPVAVEPGNSQPV